MMQSAMRRRAAVLVAAALIGLSACTDDDPPATPLEFAAQTDRPAANDYCDRQVPVCRARSAAAPVEFVDVGLESYPSFLAEIGCHDKEFRPELKQVQRESTLDAAQAGPPWHSGVVCSIGWTTFEVETSDGVPASLADSTQTWLVDLFVQVPDPCRVSDVAQLLVLTPMDEPTDQLVVEGIEVSLRPETMVMTDNCRIEIGSWAVADRPETGRYESRFDRVQYRLQLTPDDG